ncbi:MULTISPECIES: 50S ribosomal protein L11 methyltransferase [unclassified Yoonia]|uniref:50S ribosomal protein L11 methyltransferase n=1 Tax=unclassified Yoonia TaxID=2629118 RepID=UPI002AFF3231|nr:MULTISPECIES: 50S ribosomal protein L11 methyltransferase [unclassified Yoonia]
MTTYTALTTMPGEDAAYALCEALEQLDPEPIGTGVFEIEDGSGLWEVAAYTEAHPDAGALAVLAALHGAKPFMISEVPDQDWVSKVQRDLAPVPAGRFFVYGSHDADKVPDGSIPLLIEAAMAFGTGHHGTTLGCLLAFEDVLGMGFTGGRILDLGCGTAVLAMAAAKVLGGPVLASDIDPTAVEVARANVAANNLNGHVDCLVAAGFGGGDARMAGPFDLIFANILKGPLISLAPEISANTQPGGYLILSGILNEQAEEVVTIYSRNGFDLCKISRISDWATLIVQRNDQK